MADDDRADDARRTASSPAAAEPETHETLDRLWADPPGLIGRIKSVQNDVIGLRLMGTGFFFLLLGGSFDSLLMRVQLAWPELDLISPQLYNELFTNHGSVTMFLVILPIFEGFAIMVLPLILGSREMPFPRLGAFAYYTFLMGGLLYYSSTLFQLVPDAGWFAYTPLSLLEYSPDKALDFWVLGLGVAEVGAIAAGMEIVIGVLKMRAPGMTLTRIPLYAWAMLITSVMILFAFTPLIVGSLMLELDRGFDFNFFDPEQGGSSLLWQHLFWIFGHPEVYIQFLPATGIVSMVLPVMVRRRIVGYGWLVGAMVAIAVLSFGLWAHHMFATGLPPIVLAFFAAASMVIGIPAAVQIYAWVATIWQGRPRWNTPFLFVVGFLVIFVIGGITGIMVAAVPFDLQAHDTYFVVGHLHYVLIGGVAFPIFAGVYYWFPKFTGKVLGERLGRWNFWLLFVGVNVAFFPMHVAGLLGMPRRVYTYPEGTGWDIYNLISTIGVFIIVPGIGLFILNVWRSYRHGEEAGPNPWGADTLEWAVPSPPSEHGWSVAPIVHSRHPLWDQDDLHEGDTATEGLVQGMARWPLRWRAALIVGTADGRPVEIFRVADPSIWPLIAAFGTLGIFTAELTGIRWAVVPSVLTIVVAVIAWNRPVPAPMTEEEEIAFETEHGVPVRAGGSVVVASWGTAVAALFVGIAFTSFLLGYFYLRLDAPAWPPTGLPRPDLLVAAATSALAVAGGLAMHRGLRRIRVGDQAGLRTGVAVALGLGAAAVALLCIDLAGQPFGPSDHAYGSIVFSLGGFVVTVAAGTLIACAMTLVWSLRGHYSERRHAHVVNVTRFYGVMVVVWLIGIGTDYLGPYLT
ncbi:cbb3-type cytochrome c oxidase subunit I [Euzebya sp.]|uniref:cbb3-type cytochrome c oxidase subunit I n=1 Tax=Euzebya sp. TaxID=1971409 RepID=UPI0035145B2D